MINETFLWDWFYTGAWEIKPLNRPSFTGCQQEVIDYPPCLCDSLSPKVGNLSELLLGIEEGRWRRCSTWEFSRLFFSHDHRSQCIFSSSSFDTCTDTELWLCGHELSFLFTTRFSLASHVFLRIISSLNAVEYWLCLQLRCSHLAPPHPPGTEGFYLDKFFLLAKTYQFIMSIIPSAPNHY